MSITDTPAAQLITAMQQFIPAQMQAYDVPGASVALIRQARIVWAGAFGVMHVESRHPLGTASVFEAASLSKPVVTAAALKLRSRGLLDIDTLLSTYVAGETIEPTAPLDQLTARMVLCHTTGLQNWLWQTGEKPHLHFTPGSRFSYSGLGFKYLQTVMEHITGEPLAQHVQREVLAPLGMRHSSFVWRDDYAADAATGHNEDGKPVDKWKPAHAIAGASLHTTPMDYARFLISLMNSQNGAAIQMLRPRARITEDLSWGMGIGLAHTHNGDLFWHWGDNGAFKAFCMGSHSQRAGIVLLTNGANGLRLCEAALRMTMGDAPTKAVFAWLEEFYK